MKNVVETLCDSGTYRRIQMVEQISNMLEHLDLEEFIANQPSLRETAAFITDTMRELRAELENFDRAEQGRSSSKNKTRGEGGEQ